MSSGVKVDDACKLEYNNIKLKKSYRYIMFKLSEDLRSIVIKTLAPPSTTYDEFLAELRAAEQSEECRYAVYDMPIKIRNQDNAKLIFFYWSPESAKIKQKMVYAASKDALKSELGDGIAAMIQANDYDDLQMSSVLERIQKD